MISCTTSLETNRLFTGNQHICVQKVSAAKSNECCDVSL